MKFNSRMIENYFKPTKMFSYDVIDFEVHDSFHCYVTTAIKRRDDEIIYSFTIKTQPLSKSIRYMYTYFFINLIFTFSTTIVTPNPYHHLNLTGWTLIAGKF